MVQIVLQWETKRTNMVEKDKDLMIEKRYYYNSKKSDHGKRPSYMIRLHGPWCKLALNGLQPSNL
jgi:hypothetical protein